MFYFNVFLFFSILGYILEIILSIIMHQPKSTLLIGPWMPIYGIGFLIVYFTHVWISKYKFSKRKEIALLFLIMLVLLSFLEEIGGLLTWTCFHQNFWDYSNWPFSIGPYVNILVSFVWSLLSIGSLFILYPKIKNYLKRCPKWISILLLLLFLFDHIICFQKHF